MVELGHRRIALIAGPENTTTSRDRERGFREQLQASGRRFDETLRRVGQFSHHSGYQWCLDLLAAEPRPTAVFAANDVIAFGALDAARRVGVRVPAELSIVGFDDIDMAGWEGFNLTTVRQPLAEMGRAAATLLLERIGSDDELPPRRRVFPVGLVHRDTLAAAPDGAERPDAPGESFDTLSRDVVCLRMHCRRRLTSPSSPCLTPYKATHTNRSADVHQSFDGKDVTA